MDADKIGRRTDFPSSQGGGSHGPIPSKRIPVEEWLIRKKNEQKHRWTDIPPHGGGPATTFP